MELAKRLKVKTGEQTVLLYGFLLIIAAMPFHGFLATWAGHLFGNELLFKVWKEILLVGLGMLFVIILNRDRAYLRKFLSLRINQLIIGFMVLHLLLWVIKRPDIDAAVAGVLINTRYFVMFFFAQWLVSKLKAKELQRVTTKIVIATSLTAAVFAVLQFFVLPRDFLELFGYGPNSIPADFTIDDNDKFRRVASTLRGPNPLGAFMVLPFAAGVAWFLKKRAWQTALFTALIGAALLFSFSRSGWLAAGIATLIVCWLAVPKKYQPRVAVFGLTSLVIAGFVLASLASSTPTLSRLLLHDDPNTGRRTSNQLHFETNQIAAGRIADHPLGDGPGEAGPASFYNDQGKEITENYYLQLGREVGVFGISLFLAICVVLGQSFWRQRDEFWPRVLLASLVGLSVANMFLSVWADESLALVWWALAGLYYRE